MIRIRPLKRRSRSSVLSPNRSYGRETKNTERGHGGVVKAIVAMTRKRVIGYNNKIPWRLPGEQGWFKEVTMGHPILMGRKTFESIGKPLPRRRNLVVTRTGNFTGIDLIRDLRVFDPAPYESDGKEVFVIGGAEIYAALLPRCSGIYLTLVKQEFDGNTYFPEFESEFVISETMRETPEFDIFLYKRPP
ncbi:MAG: dihydrofolate reductase [Verrucomicrobia bacterium]|nr:dihydrofolate reductase [Verrucomicrobiota bacterium]